MAARIIDERTLAGWLSAPTEARAKDLASNGQDPLIFFADVEEHVLHPETGTSIRCDLTLRSKISALVNAEMKRPEVADASSPALQLDAWRKAVSRGTLFFITCNFRDVYLWETAKGANQIEPRLKVELAPGLMRSADAMKRRGEIAEAWKSFLDQLSAILTAALKPPKKTQLPPQAVDLKEAITHVAEDVALRVRNACVDDTFREFVLDAFRMQFGVEIQLDPTGSTERYDRESEQVALIAVFVVTTRLILYQALANSVGPNGKPFNLDPLEVSRSASDPQRISSDLESLYEHARRRTGNFDLQLRSTELDQIVFVDTPGTGEIGDRWDNLLGVIKKADWTGPAGYVPGLYESLLDDEHRHVMGVHYTPDPVAEVVTAFVVRNAADRVMDPSSGAGTFATMCYERKRQLGSSHAQSLAEVYAVELAEFAASLTGLNLTLADTSAGSAYPQVFRTDFFNTFPGANSPLTIPGSGVVKYPVALDGVIGNPPYIRFENRTPHERNEVLQFLHKHFTKTNLPYPDFTGKADLWAFFVAGAHMYLRTGGRLGFVLSWNLLASDYGDAVLAFLGRYFLVDAIIDSRVERWFAAKQNTVLLLARKAEDPPARTMSMPNPAIPVDHKVRFVRFKQPLTQLLDMEQPRGKRAEDLVDEILAIEEDIGEDLKWDIRVFPQLDLVARTGPKGKRLEEEPDEQQS
jgi:N-6 DNA methylase